MCKLRSAVVGLGQVGSRFDEESRPGVWSHVGAYLYLDEYFELIAGVDPVQSQRDLFSARCPDLLVCPEISSLSSLNLDVISITTPPHLRCELIELIANWDRPPKVIICEKPFALSISDREQIVSLCNDKNIRLIVNYNRRYQTLFNHAKGLIHSGYAGDICSITLKTPNRISSIGSHALNTLFYIASSSVVDFQYLNIPSLYEASEPAYDMLFNFEAGFPGRILVQGFKHQLIFDVEVICKQGKFDILDNGSKLQYSSFTKSNSFDNYEILSQPRVIFEQPYSESSFVNLMREAHGVITSNQQISSTATSAMASELYLDLLT